MSENSPIIQFKNITKQYKLYKSDKERFRAIFSKSVKAKTKKAVDDVSFDIFRGESVAMFGRNGAGKSTILKMITGVCHATSGEININGRVSALLELTSGFDPEFTGIENIRLKGHLAGLSKQEIEEIMPDIIEFAEIGDYIEQPLRTFSSGMKARLGFAINANINPEILIVDEALSVGDVEFKEKCLKKVSSLIDEKDVTLLFVTHSTVTALEFCSRGIVMRKGKKIFDGDIAEAADVYKESIISDKKEAQKKAVAKRKKENSHVSGGKK